jgi:hypothetical protein
MQAECFYGVFLVTKGVQNQPGSIKQVSLKLLLFRHYKNINFTFRQENTVETLSELS